MAFLILKDNRKVTMSAAAAGKLWRVLQGELKGTSQEIAKAKQVKSWHFARDTAPSSWLIGHPLPEQVGSESWWAKV